MKAADAVVLTRVQTWILESLAIIDIHESGTTVIDLARQLGHSPHYTGVYLDELKALKLAWPKKTIAGAVWRPTKLGHEVVAGRPLVQHARETIEALCGKAS